jgi:hypothetical protein
MKICAMTAKLVGSRTGSSAPNSTRRSVLRQNQHLYQAGSGRGLGDDLRLLVCIALEVSRFVLEGVARGLIGSFFHRLPPIIGRTVDRREAAGPR